MQKVNLRGRNEISSRWFTTMHVNFYEKVQRAEKVHAQKEPFLYM